MSPLPLVECLFYFFAALLLTGACSVVWSKNPVRSVLSLVLCFVAMAGVWLLLYAEFLALVLVLVYVGAVMTLFLFVVMMLHVDRAAVTQGLVSHWWIGVLLMLAFLGMSCWWVGPAFFSLPIPSPDLSVSPLRSLGQVLYTDYAVVFEASGVLLLASMVAAMALAFRGVRSRRVQNISEQLRANKKDRLRVVDDKGVVS